MLLEQQIKNDFWRIKRDTEDWRNDAENSSYMLKYI